MCITYSKCVSIALVIPHVMCMPLIVLSYLVCLAVQHFSTLFHKRHDFGNEDLNMKCVFLFSLRVLSEILLILRELTL